MEALLHELCQRVSEVNGPDRLTASDVSDGRWELEAPDGWKAAEDTHDCFAEEPPSDHSSMTDQGDRTIETPQGVCG